MMRSSEQRSFERITDRRAGFMLLEVLVALVVAALFLGVLAQALATAWQRSRHPLERVAALNLARAVASEPASSGERFAREGWVGGFSYATTFVPLVIELRENTLAPAPGGLAAKEKPPAADGATAILQRMTVAVRAPSGRRLTFETIRLDRSK